MLLYHLHDMQRAVLSPLRLAAEVTQATFHNPFFPVSYTELGRTVAAGAEMIERGTRHFGKPEFGLKTTTIAGEKVAVTEESRLTLPFCNLKHFRRATDRVDPVVLLVAPMSGHHATLLRGTVEALLPEHDVYITDWLDARMVPLSAGTFDLEDFISYLMAFMRCLGRDTHVMAICQPAPPVLCAAALLAQLKDPAQPRSMTLMGGPIDTGKAPTVVTKLAAERPLDWFRTTVVHALPFYYPGAYRLVYPGFLQLQGFMSMNVERHMDAHVKLFQNLVKGDDSSAAAHRKFYDEYLSVMDIPAEFYLQTVERVFQNNDLAKGTFTWRDMTVDPGAITQTALLTVEGELDDISAPGQTIPAHDLCRNLPPAKKQAHLQIGVGHYGIFNGRKWREQVLPVVAGFMRAQA